MSIAYYQDLVNVVPMAGMNWIHHCKRALYAHYTAPLESSFKQFRWGLVLFFCGMVILYGASQLLVPSLQQELVVLAGLLLGGCGFVIAILAQMRMMISRMWRFFSESKNHRD